MFAAALLCSVVFAADPEFVIDEFSFIWKVATADEAELQVFKDSDATQFTVSCDGETVFLATDQAAAVKKFHLLVDGGCEPEESAT